MKKRIVALIFLVALMVTLMVGCGGNARGEFAKEKTKFIRHNHGQEPDTLDPALNTTVNGGTLIIAAFEGLLSLDEKDNPQAGAAERWDISPDKTKYTFHLRKDAKWSDGKPVTARDFAYAWQRVLSPETTAEYAYQLFYIKNAVKYNTGEAKDEDLGFKVVDDYTFEVQLEAPTPFFLKLTAFPTLFPVREDIVTKYGEQWALKPETYIGNGPFKLVEWKRKDSMKFTKNEQYWNKDGIKLDGFIETFITDESTMLAAYEADELDVIDNVPLEEIERLQKESEEFHIIPQLGTYCYGFNVTKPPFDDVRVRKAFSLAIDREDLTNKVRKSGIPATAFVPPGVPDVEGKDFRAVGGEFFLTKAQPEEAKRLLAEAGYPGGKGLPDVTFIYNSHDEHKKIAEAVLEMWKQNLGIENVFIQNQEWAVFVNTVQKGEFQIATHVWLGDYNDPMTFIDLFTTGNGNNNTQWSNKEFDNLIEQARVSSTEKERMDILHKAEKLFLDDIIIMPIFYYTENCMIKSYVQGLHKSVLGFTYFNKAYLKE